MNRALLSLFVGGVALALAMLLALCVGSVTLPVRAVVDALLHGTGPDAQIVIVLRLPRALAAAGCGAALAVAGALLQALLRNPLADPYILGMSGGAAVGALAAVLLVGSVFAPAGALAGSIAATALLFALGARALRAPANALVSANSGGVALILIGVIIAAACGAMVSLLLVFMPDQSMRGMLIWLMGDFSGAESAVGVWLALLVLLPCVVWLAPQINLIATGELRAQSLGVPVSRRRLQIVGLAALLTAAAVHTAGTVGFVGLVTPHLLRLVLGNDQRLLLPACALGGAAFLLLADTVARSILAPTQLPVGAVTAVIGVPVFLGLLLRQRGAPAS